MPRRILVIQGHPDPSGGHLDHALAESYAQAAQSAGHQVMRVAIAGLNFPLLRNQNDFEHAPVPPALLPAAEAIQAADHIVLIFPLWLGTMPALVKAFLEQVLRPHVAFEYRDKALPKKLLAGKSARLVVTMGMPPLIYRWIYGAHGLRGLERNILKFVGISPIRETLFGLAGANEAKRARWIKQMAELGKRGV